jgi:DNA invertase Pin-like site-specific DNA recombinase
MRLGYARVSTDEQTDALQRDALEAAGCERVFSDTASGRYTSRPGLDELLAQLRPGDVLVVWRLDRLGRSLRHLLDVMATIEERDAGLQSLTEQLDTTTPAGRLIFHVFGAVAQFERELVVERTQAGLAAARARGRLGGRPRKLTDAQTRAALAMLADGSSQAAVAAAFGVHRATIARALERHELRVAA